MKLPRIRPTLSVRVLMSVVLVLGLVMAWRVDKARTQRRAVAALNDLGVSVTYDYVYADGKYNYSATPWGPTWLRRLIGDEYFQEVVEVNLLKGKDVTDEHLAILEGLPHLRRLYARSAAISDAGLRHLEGLAELEFLHIGDTSVGDAGMVSIGKLKGLNELILEETRVGDAGLTHLDRLARLRKLYLRYTRVTDRGLAKLGGLQQLQEVSLDKNQATATGRELLGKLPNLKKIDAEATLPSLPGPKAPPEPDSAEPK
jgi:hypothetical protein